MNKKILLWLVLLVVSVFFVSAADYEINFTDFNTYKSSSTYANIQVKSMRYEPYPVNPGEYFTLWIKAENIGTTLTKNAYFELVPKYPFSLDSNEDAVREYGELTSEEPVILEYKVRVDKDAVEGTNEIEIRYNTDGDDSYWIYKEFDIEVDDAQTDFDLVIQEVSDSEVSIAIANTGKNVAYSVIVRIPEQDDFQATGTNGQMVGNLENGDYTLVGFEIASKSKNAKNLKVQIDYTDGIGERRSIIKEVNFDTGMSYNISQISQFSGNFSRNGIRRTQQLIIYQQWWFWAIIIAVLYAGFKLFKFYKRNKEEKEMKKHKK
jgi:hypothetical protein